MNNVIDNPYLVSIIASNMDLPTICNFRLSSKKIKCFSKYEFLKLLICKYHVYFLKTKNEKIALLRNEIHKEVYSSESYQFLQVVKICIYMLFIAIITKVFCFFE